MGCTGPEVGGLRKRFGPGEGKGMVELEGMGGVMRAVERSGGSSISFVSLFGASED